MEYLLSRGARCEASTFDGERCIYGALTDAIRKTLQDYSVVTARVRKREAYQEYLRKYERVKFICSKSYKKCLFVTRLLEDDEHTDITFEVHGETFCAHRWVLAARSEYFRQKFRERWKDRKAVSIRNAMVRNVAFIFHNFRLN